MTIPPYTELWRLFRGRHDNPLVFTPSIQMPRRPWTRLLGAGFYGVLCVLAMVVVAYPLLWVAPPKYYINVSLMHFVLGPAAYAVLAGGRIAYGVGRIIEDGPMEEFQVTRLTAGEMVFGIFYPMLKGAFVLLLPFLAAFQLVAWLALPEAARRPGETYFLAVMLFLPALSAFWSFLLIVKFNLLYRFQSWKAFVTAVAMSNVLTWATAFVAASLGDIAYADRDKFAIGTAALVFLALWVTHRIICLACAHAGWRLTPELHHEELRAGSFYEALGPAWRDLGEWRRVVGTIRVITLAAAMAGGLLACLVAFLASRIGSTSVSHVFFFFPEVWFPAALAAVWAGALHNRRLVVELRGRLPLAALCITLPTVMTALLLGTASLGPRILVWGNMARLPKQLAWLWLAAGPSLLGLSLFVVCAVWAAPLHRRWGGRLPVILVSGLTVVTTALVGKVANPELVLSWSIPTREWVALWALLALAVPLVLPASMQRAFLRARDGAR